MNTNKLMKNAFNVIDNCTWLLVSLPQSSATEPLVQLDLEY